jgi:radical SAM superfamily enzyme YgiQ (UPF0313 family)
VTRVLFAHPFQLCDSRLEQQLMTPYPPLGLLQLAAVARDAGHDVHVHDPTFLDGPSGDAGFASALAGFKPDVVCVGAMVTLRPRALAMARAARGSGAIVVVGGPDPTASPEAYLDQGDVSVVVAGEAEGVLPGLLDTLVAAPVAEQAVVVRPGTGDIVAHLDTLPLPARDLVDVRAYLQAWREAHGYGSLNLAVGRGCPSGCDDCAAGGRAHFRLRSPGHVAAEMADCARRWAPDSFRIVDELDDIPSDWLTALDEAMDDAGVATPYEGLRRASRVAATHFAPIMDLCGIRSSVIPQSAPHGAPSLDAADVVRLWTLMPDEVSSDP